ncbi:MAG: mannitol dehydrogenase family protein [Acidimicrobiales bacterium]
MRPVTTFVYGELVQSDTIPLSAGALVSLGEKVAVPGYERAQLRRSIVHIGVGGFHRAHLATYVHELCSRGHRDWAIVGSGVLASDEAIATTLAAQDHLYCLITRAAEQTSVEIIGSIVDYQLAFPDPEPLVLQIASPDTQIVSLTITEAGYPVDDSTGQYQSDSAMAGEGSAFAAIAAGLQLRWRAGLGPLTVLSCDNIVSNGQVARRSLVGEAARIDPSLAEWIDSSIAFPNSMVDRITPATSPSDREWLREHRQIDDRWPVVTEPFRQWVVEDDFAGDRPPLEELDVIVTSDVEPYELAKLRLLNAGHSSLAYLAALGDIEYVHSAMADPSIRRYLTVLLETEAKPVLPPVAGIDLDAYIQTLIERFSNPQIRDQIARLCMDGSAKFPKFLLPTIGAQLEADGPIALGALAVAGWCEYLNGVTGSGRPIELAPDPLLSEASARAAASRSEPTAFLDFPAVFPVEIADHPRFVAAFDRQLRLLRTGGVTSAIESALEGQ